MWNKLFDLEHDQYGLKTIFHIFIGMLIFVITQITASIVVDIFYLITKFEWQTFYVISRIFFEISFFYYVLRLYIYKALKLDLSYFRMNKPRFSLSWILIALLLPITVIIYYFFFTKGVISYGNNDSISLNVAFALKVGLSAGIIEELLFRGYIMKLLEERWNIKVAITVPSIIFASLHLMKGMGMIDIALLFVAGITVSIMFSLVTYHSGNVYNAALIHTIWNTLIIGLFNISPQNDLNSLINYVLKSDNVLITGGRFGIEAAVPAISAYIIVIIISFSLSQHYKKEKYSVLESSK